MPKLFSIPGARLFSLFSFPKRTLRSVAAAGLLAVAAASAGAQAVNQNQLPGQAAGRSDGDTQQPARSGGESKTASGQGAAEGPGAGPDGQRTSATGAPIVLSALAPAAPPTRVFARPRIGLALGGGGALGLTEVGTLAWFEEHHIPVDVIAGTSMGCMISALYSSGRSPQELMGVMNDTVFQSVFSFSNAYTSRSFRRREDSRELPNGIPIGLKHRVSLRNALLTDQGLNAFLDREFVRYNDRLEFNALPIPLRCVATDLTEGEPVTFARGSLPDAVRASVSIPGVFTPFQLGRHELVDGVVTENLPTPAVHAMQADVVLAVSIPMAPLEPGDLDSLLGVVGRAAAVSTSVSEARLRKLADVVMIPDIAGMNVNDYLKTPELAKRGYAAAEAHKVELLKYAISDEDWAAYLAHRRSLMPGAPAPVLRVRVDAPTLSARKEIDRMFRPLVNQPVNTAQVEALLDEVRADGRYDADYTVGYESEQRFDAQAAGAAPLPAGTVDAKVATSTSQAQAQAAEGAAGRDGQGREADGTQGAAVVAARPEAQGLSHTQLVSDASLAAIARRPVILVTVHNKKTGPPFVVLGANLEAQTGGITSATVEAIVLDQDLGGYGSELRSHVRLGYLTDLSTEYYHPLIERPHAAFFVAPRGEILRQPFPIFNNAQGAGVRLATRQYQSLSTGADVGLTDSHKQELRAGFDFQQIRWTTQIGNDGQPDYLGTAERARLRYVYDNADRALVPQFGLHLVLEGAYRFHMVASPDAPEFDGQAVYSRRFALKRANLKDDPQRPHKKGGELFVMAADGGTLFGRNVAQPFRYAIGGPPHLSASTLDQYRGTEYFVLQPALLRRVFQLPAPLGQSAYLGAAYEFGRISAPDAPTIQRQDVFFGLVAETPLGVITFGPALGDHGEHKLVFTIGRLF